MAIIHSNTQVSKPPVDRVRVADIIRELLQALGEDPDREGLADTPRRVADFWREFLDYSPGKVDTAFTHSTANQMVVVKGMEVWSLCEHHLLPFRAVISIGYIPNGQVLGLSKFGRIAQKHAHALQLQERLVEQIAADIAHYSGSADVAVFAEGEHLCMSMRGIHTPATMQTSVLRGAFLETETRAEFMALVRS